MLENEFLEPTLSKKEDDWLSIKSATEEYRDSQSTEVLFIEQDYRFLKEGGCLAIVLPDGVLTNSTMQYVRTYCVSEKYSR